MFYLGISMNVNLAKSGDKVEIGNDSISIVEIDNAKIFYKTKTIKYSLYFSVNDQDVFLPEKTIMGAIVYEEMQINLPCIIYIDNKKHNATITKCFYHPSKHRYFCEIVQNVVEDFLVVEKDNIVNKDIKSELLDI
jgi:hypothetical protein